MKLGMHTVKTWSSTQASVALSSGEAEYSAAVKGCSQALGFAALLSDLGVPDLPVEVQCDSSAAIGIANRTGLGKVRHIAVHLLWLQGKVRNKEVSLIKIDGSKNLADLFTKYLDGTLVDRYTSELGMTVELGRSGAAPALE